MISSCVSQAHGGASRRSSIEQDSVTLKLALPPGVGRIPTNSCIRDVPTNVGWSIAQLDPNSVRAGLKQWSDIVCAIFAGKLIVRVAWSQHFVGDGLAIHRGKMHPHA